jgi:hypothetical protein
MEGIIRDEVRGGDCDPDRVPRKECNVVKFQRGNHDRDSLSENFTNELDAWARMAFAANGFGDY